MSLHLRGGAERGCRIPFPTLSLPDADRRPVPDTFCTSGSSPGRTTRTARTGQPRTVHLIGPGRVGQALLALLAENGGIGYRLCGVTDSTATICSRQGLDPLEVAAFKANGGRLGEHAGSERIPVPLAVDLVDAEVVVDAVATDLSRSDEAAARGRAVLRRGAFLVLASKTALCTEVPEWLGAGSRHARRIGCNAVLGGTGRRLVAELVELRARWRSAALCGNASTTAIVDALEAGRTLAEGIVLARRRGFLEADPEQDLRGDDAARKLAIVAGALTGVAHDPRSIPVEDVRELDPAVVRRRAVQGGTTRLIGRFDRSGGLRVRYEALPRTSPLAAPPDRVVYAYHLDGQDVRVHVGTGVGPRETARAVLADIVSLAPCVPAAGGVA